jgi:hypothetical protein
MTQEIITHVIAFLAGALSGAAGKYLRDKYTDRKRGQGKRGKKHTQFRETREKMPELIAEMKEDLSKPESASIREFFVSRKEYSLNTEGPCLIYYENDHPNLTAKVHILENMGYVKDVTPGNAPKYRMTEEFVKLVLGSKFGE